MERLRNKWNLCQLATFIIFLLLLLLIIAVNKSMNTVSDRLNMATFLVGLSFSFTLLVVGWLCTETLIKLQRISKLTRKEQWVFDVCLLTLVSLFAICLMILHARDELDMQESWVFLLIVGLGYGIGVALVYATIGLLMRSHKGYSIIAAIRP